jgi:hypothetical protein
MVFGVTDFEPLGSSTIVLVIIHNYALSEHGKLLVNTYSHIHITFQ